MCDAGHILYAPCTGIGNPGRQNGGEPGLGAGSGGSAPQVQGLPPGEDDAVWLDGGTVTQHVRVLKCCCKMVSFIPGLSAPITIPDVSFSHHTPLSSAYVSAAVSVSVHQQSPFQFLNI